MKSDLLIVRLKQDKSLCDELLLEMRIRGVHSDFAVEDNPANLERQLVDYSKEHALVMPLITEAFVEWLDAADVVISTANPEILFLAFGLKADAKAKAQRRLKGVEFPPVRAVASYADEALRAMALPSRSNRLQQNASVIDIWRTPLYIFRKKDKLKDREILVDVTWSSKPTRAEMAPALETALRKSLDYLAAYLKTTSLKILDFGAGNLRHSVPLLELGHQVTAVDYQDIYDKPTTLVKNNLAEAQKYADRFGKLVYPSGFVTFKGQFDLVLLINVLNIMPEPLERLFVLEHCGNKLKNNGHLLWFCQYGDRDQLAAASDIVTDGGCTMAKFRKTFYKDYNDQEHIIRLMKVMGFEHVSEVKVDASRNHALLFRKTGTSMLQTLPIIKETRKILERKVYVGASPSEVAVANVLDAETYVGLGAALGATLSEIVPGRAGAYEFEEIIRLIIEYVFRNHFKSSTIRKQFEIHEGRKRIDITAEWRANSSLKTVVTEDNNLKSSLVPIECKNYAEQLSNEEFGQMVDRCHTRHRRFGIITCRKIDNRKRIIKHCCDRYDAHEYLIIVLDDSDLKQLLRYADETDADKSNDDKIVEYIARKITEVRDLAI